MVDEIRVLRLLRSITDDLAVLQRETSADDQRRADLLWIRGVKYTFVTAIEACVDVAQHICASQGWGPPRDNGDAVRLLGSHGVLPADLAARLRRAVGFRNVLVHEYVAVDDDVVLARLDDPSDLAEFVAAVAGWAVPGGCSPAP
ncbi:MAG: type VII toxin-antitoxin system HepT family RNase toxin [Pseudonocardia sp.]